MKKLTIMVSLALIAWTAGAQHEHSQMSDMGKEKSTMNTEKENKGKMDLKIFVQNSSSAKGVIDNYLSLENALSADDGKEAAASGKALYAALSKIDPSQAKSRQKQLSDILADAKENAEHISKNGNDIAHQREHFSILGNDIKDLITITGSDRTLYQIFCPMANNHEGAIWLNDSRKINNPYFGHKMPSCGSVQQEILLK